MVDLDTLFKGKKITQVGLGSLGRGIGDAAFLARHGAELMVTDLQSKEDLANSLQALEEYKDIRYHFGEHVNEDFTDRDLILKGAGVPLDSPSIAHARQNDIPIDMSASLFARFADIPFVGVTGTRGKSTVTHILNAILQADGRKTLLGGNVRGVSNLALLEEVTNECIGVFELDSWQCQGLSEERSLAAPGVRQGPLSPSLAVFTSFMTDHMNYYHDSMERYLEDKAHIFLHQTEADTLVIGAQAYEALAPYKSRIRSHVVVADADDVPDGWHLQLLGVHNRYNVAIAVAAARAFGVDMDTVRAAVESFKAVKGRLEHLYDVSGTAVYNDTNATTPDATAASLRALDPENTRNVVLIAGGMDKGLDPTPMVEAVHDTCKHVLLLPGTGSDKLVEKCKLTAGSCTKVDTLRDAMNEVLSVVAPGDILLFSPGYTSHNLFKNEYERGDQFEELIAMI